MKKPKIPVVYRKCKSGEIIALFPTINLGRDWVNCYMLSHTENCVANYEDFISCTSPASISEYTTIHNHLQYRHNACELVIKNRYKRRIK